MRSLGIAGVLSARSWAALPGAPGSGVQPLTGNATCFLSQSLVLVVSRSGLGQGTPGQGKHSPYLIGPLFDQSHC